MEFGRQVVAKRDFQIAQVVLPWGCTGGALALCICRDDRGILGAEIDVPRSVTKRVTSLYYTLYLYLSFVSSLPFVPWFGRSYCTLVICLSPSLEAIGLTFSKTFLVVMNAMMVCETG